MRIATKILLFFIGMSNINSQTIIQSGEIFGRWGISNSPYNIYGDLTIPNNKTLIIDPDVEVIFQGHYQLNVKGQIIAIGDTTKRILFSIYDTTGFHKNDTSLGGWNGIRFDNVQMNNDTSILSNCIIEYGKALGKDEESPDNKGGGIYEKNSPKLIIENCIIRYNKANGYPKKIFEALMYLEGYGGGIFADKSIIRNNLITNNTSITGGGIYGGNCYNNVICFNEAENGAGSACNKLTNNFICNNYSSNTGGGAYEPIELIGNIICNNYCERLGGGVFLPPNSNEVLIYNNTICNNEGGYGIYFWTSSPSLYNNIIWRNDPNQLYLGGDETSTSNPNFYNCDIQDGINGFSFDTWLDNSIGDYINNISNEPMFNSPTLGLGSSYNAIEADWSLKNTSLCINAGYAESDNLNIPNNDILGNERIFGIFIDIGAIENQNITGRVTNQLNNESIYVFPNPFKDYIYLNIQGSNSSYINVRLFSINGEIIIDYNIKPLQNNFGINLSHIPEGIYFFELVTFYQNYKYKILKIE